MKKLISMLSVLVLAIGTMVMTGCGLKNLVAPEDISLTYTTFYDVLIELMANPKLDIYVTGSNSRTLSKDVATNFRDRGQEITVYPLSFSEYFERNFNI